MYTNIMILIAVGITILLFIAISQRGGQGYVESLRFPAKPVNVLTNLQGDIMQCHCGNDTKYCAEYYNSCIACPSALN